MRAVLIRTLCSLLFLGGCLAAGATSAQAIPVFAHRFGVTCQTCHTTVPHLNDFGESFLANGYRWPANALVPRGAFPAALKVQLAYSSTPGQAGLSKAIVDEIEILSGGSIGKHASYFIEQYVVDGGRPGSTRDAWVRFDARPSSAPQHLALTAGQFTLPLPVEPESFRETINHYAIFDQTAGANPFTFFDPRQGIDVAYTARGFNLHALALAGHDPQSGLARSGIDTMVVAAYSADELTLSAYRYGGTRPLGGLRDRFERHGFAAEFARGRLLLDGVWQLGGDSNARDGGGALRVSGGFAQARYAFSPRFAIISRIDATTDGGGVGRAFTTSLVLRPARNMRLTLEDVLQRGRHTATTALLFAY